ARSSDSTSAEAPDEAACLRLSIEETSHGSRCRARRRTRCPQSERDRVPAYSWSFRREEHVQTFATTVPQLLVLADWLAAYGITQVVMDLSGAFSNLFLTDKNLLIRLNELQRQLLDKASESPRKPRPAPPKPSPVLETVTLVLEREGRPMRVSAIHAAATELLGRPLRWSSVRGCPLRLRARWRFPLRSDRAWRVRTESSRAPPLHGNLCAALAACRARHTSARISRRWLRRSSAAVKPCPGCR